MHFKHEDYGEMAGIVGASGRKASATQLFADAGSQKHSGNGKVNPCSDGHLHRMITNGLLR